jgi:hypothetical protein
MGNLQAESRMKSDIYEESYKNKIGLSQEDYVKGTNNGTFTNFINDKVGFGLVQWTASTRKQGLFNTCKGHIEDLDCQLKYLIYEFKHDFHNLLSFLKISHNIKNCSDKVMIEFEKPADISESPKKKRYDNSKTFYDKFSHISTDSSSNSNSISFINPTSIYYSWAHEAKNLGDCQGLKFMEEPINSKYCCYTDLGDFGTCLPLSRRRL